ncbi:MAG TPA: hypothetical protein VKU19_13605 [Bryobacteraceae bacterium]|nr:hypothetical protein [Bryobacteraceae bacterium]
MNLQEIARLAAVRGLMAHGLTENMAERVTHRMVTFQADEWARILERVNRGEVRNLYVLVTHYDSSNFGTFLYAPAEVNNIATLTAWLGSQMGAGCLADNPVDEDEPDLEPDAYSVSVFDIANEVKRGLRGGR